MLNKIPKISLIMPTRHRSNLALSFLQSAWDKSQDPNEIEVVMYVDDDDDSYDNFCSPFENTKLIRGSRLSMSMYNRACADKSSGEILFFVNDDITVKTHGWDSNIRSIHMSFEDKIYLSYPNDCFKKDKLAVFPIISKALYESCPILPDSYKGSFIDSHIHETFRFLKKMGQNRIVYIHDTIFQHDHYRLTGNKPDATYENRARFGDDEFFFKSVLDRVALAKQLNEVILNKYISVSPRQNSKKLNSIFTVFIFYLFFAPAEFRYRVSVCMSIIFRYGYAFVTRANKS
jgi:hypothetical protein